MRHAALAVALLSAVMLGPLSVASPNGVGEQGDNGCLCHGGPSLDEAIHLHGWPTTYEPGSVYALHLNASTSSDANGGFRLVVDGGTLVFNASSKVQSVDEGLTHTAPSSLTEGWFAEWVAPNATDVAVRAALHVNLVNENGASDGDHWATLSMVSTGPDHAGIIEEKRDDALTPAAVGVAVLGLAAVVALLAVGLREPGKV
ncbi:MAG: choice-of-anchor V domain-containing protein [Candidatus Poseidoniaceae archaeon]